MQTVVLDDIPARLPVDDLLRKLRVAAGSPRAEELMALIREAESIGRPKALCGVAYIEDRGEDSVVVDGIRFQSRVMAVNLEKTHRVFPYLATCGTELDRWAHGTDDMLHRYWADALCEAAIRNARSALVEHLNGAFDPGEMSRMSPGSLPDWPIEEQAPLFRLLGETQAAVGVRLTDSYLMLPVKSVSGIYFSSSSSYENCMLCPRDGCPNRRAPHDPALYNSRYRR